MGKLRRNRRQKEEIVVFASGISKPLIVLWPIRAPQAMDPISWLSTVSLLGSLFRQKYREQSDGLAHVAICDVWGNAVYQSWCIPDGKIIDYRTSVSGVTEEDICGAPSFDCVRGEVLSVIKGHTLLGHSIKYDLESLRLTHLNLPVLDTFAIAKEKGHQAGSLKLRSLCILYQIRDASFQSGEHNPLDDARATMDLYEALNQKP